MMTALLSGRAVFSIRKILLSFLENISNFVFIKKEKC